MVSEGGMNLGHWAVIAALLGAAPGLAQPEQPAPELWLFRRGPAAQLSRPQTRELLATVAPLLDSCHTYADVVGREQPQHELRQLWRKHTHQPHLLLRARGALASRHQLLDHEHFELLLGIPAGEGLSPVLSRTAGGFVTSYAKCSGLEGIRLSCRIRSLEPAAESPVQDCDRLGEIEAALEREGGNR